MESLRQELAPEPLNTGRTITLPRFGIVTDDIEAPHAILDSQGRVRLAVGQEFSNWLYRGQTRDWSTCKSGLARLDSPRNQILEIARTVAFEDIVETHLLVIKAREVRLLGSPLSIDITGIAQHYDLCTDMLDLTCNFLVASFFAACRFNRRRSKWEPVRATAEPGVIYRASRAHLSLTQVVSEQGSLEIVGWQPFPRPEQQRAFAIRLKRHSDFHQHPHTQRFLFRQERGVSARIYEMFEGGALLFPEDSVAQLADEAKQVKAFTRSQLERAWLRLEDWLGHVVDENDRCAAEMGASIAEGCFFPLVLGRQR
ncbi:MAG: FRG domain-containing protein [Sulfuricella sp.]|nr:FRG domain-containing protein [Sulfuricella sp.]